LTEHDSGCSGVKYWRGGRPVVPDPQGVRKRIGHHGGRANQEARNETYELIFHLVLVGSLVGVLQPAISWPQLLELRRNWQCLDNTCGTVIDPMALSNQPTLKSGKQFPSVGPMSFFLKEFRSVNGPAQLLDGAPSLTEVPVLRLKEYDS
jgi:hypothetical protein